MALYIRFDKLKGDVTDKGYKDYSALSHLIFPGINTGITNQVGRNDYHRAGAPHFAPIQIFKPIDSTSPQLFTAVCNSKVFQEVEIVDTGSSNNSQDLPITVTTLKNVRISHYSKGHAAEGHLPKEMITLSYSSISERLAGKNSDGSVKTPTTAGFDLEKVDVL